MNDQTKSPTRTMSRFAFLSLVVLAVGLIVLAAVGHYGVGAVGESTSTYSSLITLLFALVGIGGFTILLIGLAIILAMVKLSDHPYAMGLPQGSIRAVLALSLVIVFVATSVYLVGMADLERGKPSIQETRIEPSGLAALKATLGADHAVVVTGPEENGLIPVSIIGPASGEARVDLAKQIFTTVATVLVTVIGFYFGSRSTASSAEDEAARRRLATGERTATETKLDTQLAAATKLVGEIEKAAVRANQAKAGAQSNADGADEKTKKAMVAELQRVQKASADASAALSKARGLLEAMTQASQAAKGADAGKASAEAAETLFAQSMSELEVLSRVAGNAATKAEKIVSRGSALQARYS